MGEMKERIVFLRELAGLSSTKMASLCGWSIGRYSHYETGKRKMSVDDILVFCSATKHLIGDRFIFLCTGMDNDEYFEFQKISPSSGMIHRDDAFIIFKTVLERAVRQGLIRAASDSDIEDIELDFSNAIGEQLYDGHHRSGEITDVKFKTK